MNHVDEILEYLNCEDCSLETLLDACDDYNQLILYLFHMQQDGLIQIYHYIYGAKVYLRNYEINFLSNVCDIERTSYIVEIVT